MDSRRSLEQLLEHGLSEIRAEQAQLREGQQEILKELKHLQEFLPIISNTTVQLPQAGKPVPSFAQDE